MRTMEAEREEVAAWLEELSAADCFRVRLEQGSRLLLFGLVAVASISALLLLR